MELMQMLDLHDANVLWKENCHVLRKALDCKVKSYEGKGCM